MRSATDSRMWEVKYRLRPSEGEGQADIYRDLYMGPFWERDNAEQALTTLAANPQFRGGYIQQAKE